MEISLLKSCEDWEIPNPVLFNVWKHHAGLLRRQIADVGRDGPAALAALPDQLVVMGTELMDLYTGPLPPGEIASKVLALLEADGRLPAALYRPWVEENGGYRTLTFAEDGTVWVLRVADEERYVHLHPGRWTPLTRRVRANVLKTAVLVLAHTAVHGGDPRDVKLVNRLRTEHLGLSPMREVVGDQGLGVILDLLQRGEG
jgi:hypothetical protein